MACTPRTFASIQPPVVEPQVAAAPELEPPPDDSGFDHVPGAETPPVEPAPPAETAPAAEQWTPPPPACSYVYRMAFPVVGGGNPGWSLFGEARDGGARLHAGVDIGAPKMTPVVAVRSGTVTTVRDAPGDCCWVAIRHDDGWVSMYVHLNNDTIGTNDGAGIGIRPGLVPGTKVEEGELVGWVGDSGNAEGGPPHLHFELRTPWGEPIDPGPSLFAARRRAHPALLDLPLGLSAGAFVDYPQEATGRIFDIASAVGVPAWCDRLGVLACPQDVVTRDAVARWITALSGDASTPYVYFTLEHPVDDQGLLHVEGCETPPLCDQPVTRGEVAQMVVTALHGSALDQSASIALLHSTGRIDACDPRGLEATDPLSRVATLRMLLRAWGYLSTPPCGSIT